MVRLWRRSSTEQKGRFDDQVGTASAEPVEADGGSTGLTSHGRCPSCNREVNFSSTDDWLRDHFLCEACGSIPRERALMLTVERFYPDWREATIHESSPSPRGTSLRLRGECSDYIGSQFYLDGSRGEWRDGMMHQDLESMSFADDSIDLHISQDVLEHVFNPQAVFRDVARTLRPGGMHIFTTPLVRKNQPSRVRARLSDSGVEHVLPAEYHGNPISDEGSLVTFDWGYDIVRHIQESCGLPTAIVMIDDLSHGIRAEYIEVLVTFKPLA